ncbi:MAG: replicative DNA helicase [Chloroflexi bacterium]|nr:replicative DNA helicase [Chloroflexota bacterium]
MAPHSVEAEEAVLGSILINPEALFDVAAFLQPDDFFIVRNGWVWEAIMNLHHNDEEIDNLTVIEELRRQERLEEVGGPAYITYLINHTPSSIYAEAYGRIVERASLRRRMLTAASEIAQLAHEESADINEVIDRAESALFNVTERRLRKELVPLDAAISEYYDRIEGLYGRGEDLLGVPTGFMDLDDLLGGLQKSDLLIVAGRPGMGKTSWLMSVALNAARAKARVAYFSLEMGNEQIVQRLISSETGISTHSLRLGDLNEREWALFVEAAGNLSKLKVNLDDTPVLTPLQMRTKCRRLHMDTGLDVVMVDYLQLMTGGIGRTDNRVQEISYISRSLKQLARELNVPVLAAAQLSRAVEQRQDKRPQLSDLRESGCLAGDTLIDLATGGHTPLIVPIRELAGQAEFGVRCLDTHSGQLTVGTVSNAFCTGVKPVFRLTTRQGHAIRATANHRFLTRLGWRRLDELAPGERIASGEYTGSGDRSGPRAPRYHSWDRVASVIPDEVEPVYDLTVPGPSNFVANGLVVHNSIEQDADVVMFIYRDEVYNDDTDRPNQADIIVAKHRNGPTGVVTLFFRKELTQFGNLRKSDLDLAGF